jgi:phage/plasmid-like protein (TIGR03299 family)
MSTEIETNIYGARMLTGFTERRTGGFGGAGVQGAISIEQANSLIGWLPYESERVDVTIITDEGVVTIPDPDAKHLVHPVTHEILGRHLSGYKVHGYADTLLRDAQAITSGSELGIAKVTMLGGGRRAAVQYEFNENVTTKRGIQFRPFLSAATSLDGSIATSFFTGSQVIICDNTLQLALRKATAAGDIYKVKHTRNSEVNVADARRVLDIVFNTSDAFAEEFDKLASQFVSDQQWIEILDELAPLAKDTASARTRGNAERKRVELSRLWNFDDRVAPWKNSAYGVVAATNTWANHVQVVKGADRAERNVARLIDGSFAKSDVTTLRVLERVL